jgi:hypothetical protein
MIKLFDRPRMQVLAYVRGIDEGAWTWDRGYAYWRPPGHSDYVSGYVITNAGSPIFLTLSFESTRYKLRFSEKFALHAAIRRMKRRYHKELQARLSQLPQVGLDRYL